MANLSNPDTEEVRIFQPGTSLKDKLGPNVSFDQVITPKVIEAAQGAIVKSSDEILAKLNTDLARLQDATDRLSLDAMGKSAFTDVIEAAFSIKSQAGLCGYAFASSLAKSLHVYCELDKVSQQALTAKSLDIIRCQVTGLKTIFANKFTGDGGAVGATILSELQKLSD